MSRYSAPIAWARCSCGARVDIFHGEHGAGYVGRLRDACPECYEAAEKERERQYGLSEANGPEGPHWNAGWDY